MMSASDGRIPPYSEASSSEAPPVANPKGYWYLHRVILTYVHKMGDPCRPTKRRVESFNSLLKKNGIVKPDCMR